MSDTLVVNEIYLSLQGESTFAGLPCVFVRLTGCNLRCSYCDTAYAFAEGKRMSLEDVRAEVRRWAKSYENPNSEIRNRKLPMIELTGGEPLLQVNSSLLMKQLCDDGFTVLVETSGALDISQINPRVRRIMDLKCPSSGRQLAGYCAYTSNAKSTYLMRVAVHPGFRRAGVGRAIMRQLDTCLTHRRQVLLSDVDEVRRGRAMLPPAMRVALRAAARRRVSVCADVADVEGGAAKGGRVVAEYLMVGVLAIIALMLAGYAVEEIFRSPVDPDEYGEPRE